LPQNKARAAGLFGSNEDPLHHPLILLTAAFIRIPSATQLRETESEVLSTIA